MNNHSTEDKQEGLQCISRPQKQDTKKQRKPVVESLLILPDAILVHIGKFVAKLGGTRDFIHFSLASKQLKQLLMDSEEVVSEIIKMRVDMLKSFLLPSHSYTPIVVNNLEQMLFCEDLCFHGHNLLEDNHVLIPLKVTRSVDPPNFSKSNGIDVQQIFKAFSALKIRSTDSLLVIAHCGTGIPVPYDVAHHITLVVGTVALKTISDSTKLPNGICKLVPSGNVVAVEVSQSQHPYQKMAQQETAWLEFYFIRTFDDGSTIRMPPPPAYYRSFVTP